MTNDNDAIKSGELEPSEPLLNECRRHLALATRLSGMAIVAAGLCFQGRLIADEPARAVRVDAEIVSFNEAIQPLLRRKCVNCHGVNNRKAELTLSDVVGIQDGGESGPVIVAGEPSKSLLFQRVQSGEMPPDEKDRLSESEILLISNWIASGAKMDHHSIDPGVAQTLNQHDVIPIMLRRCTVCHGHRTTLANLDLRTRASMLTGGKSGPAFVPGKPDDSLMLKRIHAGEMPPLDRLVEASVKPMEAFETAVLTQWIASGAPEVSITPDVATTEPDPLVADEDRSFWAFQSPTPREVRVLQNPGRVRNEVDTFILEKLQEANLNFAPEADRTTLIRRASFDLTGLPPEPAEVQAFVSAQDPQAYEKLIDRLLASPRYGERWGRYWLDVAGYADSEGKREQDLPRPFAWRYRDYVIRAFNADKPYDQFLLEQLAGDELADYEHASEITEAMADNLVATAFLRMAPDATWANITGYLPDRIEVIADEIDVLGSAVMGLTLKCARCHSHKFDPIPHRDYYRMVAIFKGAYDEYDWLKPEVKPGIGPVSQDFLTGRHLPFVATKERKAWDANEARVMAEIDAARQRGETEDHIKALHAQRTAEPRIQALWDRGEPSPTYLYRRGDPLSPTRLIGPGVPSVLTDGKTPLLVEPPWPGATQTGRRLAFAKWIVRRDHPLTARVMVNRIWKHHFGTGLVRTLANFGKAGTPPTHPELLDWLAIEFVRQDWSIKSMHRTLMTSTTYRQSSTLSEQSFSDSSNSLYSRMPMTRLDAEALYDSLLLISGQLNENRFGPADAVQSRADGLVTPVGTADGWRRLIYVQQLRKKLATHMENFDFPQMNPNCVERRDSLVAPQALHLMNNGMVFELAEHFAQRVLRDVGNAAAEDFARQVDEVYWIALSRGPSDDELEIGIEALNQLATNWSKTITDAESVRVKALSAYCHAIMNSAGFLYID